MSTFKDTFPRTGGDGITHVSFAGDKTREWRKEAEERKENLKQVEQGYVSMASDGLLIAMVPKATQ